MQEITQRHNAQRHLAQSDDCIFSILLTMCTYTVWRNMLSCICQSIGRQFMCYVYTLTANKAKGKCGGVFTSCVLEVLGSLLDYVNI